MPVLPTLGTPDQDEEMGPGGTEQLASGLDRHGLQHVSFPGHDHDGMLAHINDAIPSVLGLARPALATLGWASVPEWPLSVSLDSSYQARGA